MDRRTKNDEIRKKYGEKSLLNDKQNIFVMIIIIAHFLHAR